MLDRAQTVLKSRFSRLALVVLAVVPAASGCATQQVLQEYEEEIVRLREEKTALAKDNQGLLGEVSSLEAMLARAQNQSNQIPASSPAPDRDLGGVTVTTAANGDVIYRVPSAITFGSGSATLSDGGKATLQTVARDLVARYPESVFWIEGHTDNDQPTKSRAMFPTNRELSLARGKAVHEYLVTQGRVPDSQCVVAGHGEYQPVVPNSSPANKAQNRRVDIVVKATRL